MTAEQAVGIELGQVQIRSTSTGLEGIALYRDRFWFKGSLHCSLSCDGVKWFDYQDLEVV